MKAAIDPYKLYEYLQQLFQSGKFDRLMGDRFFQGTITAITGSGRGFRVQIQRTGDAGSDGNTYLCSMPGYVPAVGDVVECIWRDLNVGYVLWPVAGTRTPLGVLSGGYAQVTAGQSGITAAVELTGLTTTVTCGAGRRTHIKGLGLFLSTVADDVVGLSIFKDGSQINGATFGLRVVGQLYTAMVEAYDTPTAGAHTYKLQASRNAGTGSITMTALTTNPAFIAVEDAGSVT